MLDEFLFKPVAGMNIKECDPQEHRRVEAVPSTEGNEFLDSILAEEKAKKKG